MFRSNPKEFKANHLDNGIGLMGQEETKTVYLEENSLSLNGIKNQTTLVDAKRQHSKLAKQESFYDYSIVETSPHEEDNRGNHRVSFAFSEDKDTDMKSPKTEFTTGSAVLSKRKSNFNERSQVSRQKYDPKGSTTNGESNGNNSCLSAMNSSGKTCSGIEIQDQKDEDDALFLKLKSIGKLSSTDGKVDIYDLKNQCSSKNEFGWSPVAASPENLKPLKTKASSFGNEVSKIPNILSMADKEGIGNVPCRVTVLNVPELQFDEVDATEDQISGKYANEKRTEECKTKMFDRLRVPKDTHKFENGRTLKVKKTNGEGEGYVTGKYAVHQDKTYQNKPQVIQSDIINSSKIHENGDVQSNLNHNESAKILPKRRIEKRNLASLEVGNEKTENEKSDQNEDFSSLPVLDDVDAGDNPMSPSFHSLPSLPGESSGESLVSTANPPEPSGSLKEYERQNLAKQKDLKREFRLKIAEAKKMLLEARLVAQKQTAARRFNEALKKHTEIKLKRAFMKESVSKSITPSSLEARRPSSSFALKTFKDVSLSVLSKGVSDIQEIRKAQADFDRAKVKQIQTKMKLQNKQPSKNPSNKSTDPNSRKLKYLKKKDRERLEKYEVEKMISELRSLNMNDYANKLSEALSCKEEYEAKLRHELSHEKELAAQLAKKQKLEELARIREEEKRKKMAEKERLEQERREREALEIAKRQAEAIKRRERNLKLRESFNYTMLSTDMSRSFTYSYLPTLKKQPPKVKMNDRQRLKKVKAKYLEGI